MRAVREEGELRVTLLVDLGRILAERPLKADELEAASASFDEIQGADLVDAVDTLVSEGIEEARLKTAVSRLLNLVSKPLGRIRFEPTDPFFSSLLLENVAFLSRLDALRPLVARLAAGSDRGLVESLKTCLGDLSAMNIHYVKKENVLFPHFEARYPRYRCLSLMWSLHDDVRSSLSSLASLLHGKEMDVRQAGALLGRLFFDSHALVFREEKLLFPLVSGLLDPSELTSLYIESRAFGFCFLSPEQLTHLDHAAAAGEARGDRGGPPNPVPFMAPPSISPSSPASLLLDSGSLEPHLVDQILKSLPVDITFVDAEDRVAYFSNSGERVFPRSPSIIGRDVRNCHPARSLGRVLGIIESFRKAEREREEFWLETGGRFVHIEYRAMRDAAGAYLGTLEISQDIGALRALEGEKRLPS